MNVLERVMSEDFILAIGHQLPPKAMRHVLMRTEECKHLRAACWSGNLTETGLRRYVQDLLGSFMLGEKFPHDLTLALLAVSMERLRTPFAEEYLTTLASLELSEMSLSTRVAECCLQARRQMTINVHRQVSLAPVAEFNVYQDPMQVPEQAVDYRKVEAA